MTEKCVDSILSVESAGMKRITIIDNGSGNGTGKQLEERYKDYNNITVIYSEQNLGFARGNNLGYKYAKTHGASFIVVCNNDLIFNDTLFEHKIIEDYFSHSYAVAGPSLIDQSGTIMTPIRLNRYSKKQVVKAIRKKQTFLYVLKTAKRFKILSFIIGLASRYVKNDYKRWEVYYNTGKDNDIVISGACVIFSPSYVQVYDEAFCPDTFMYCEEYILAYKCGEINNPMRLIRAARVLHIGGGSTEASINDEADRMIFQLRESIKSLHVLQKLMKG